MKAKMLIRSIFITSILLILLNGMVVARTLEATPLGTSFTYQGQIKVSGVPYTGLCNFGFGLYDALNLGNPIGTSINRNIYVDNGLFTTELDFGTDVFTGDARWLQISVKCPHDAMFSWKLNPRQPITPAPYALNANTALGIPGLYTQMNEFSPNIIGGYSGNLVNVGIIGATIGGGGYEGYPNSVTNDWGTVSGGYDNQANWQATVSGGTQNTASGDSSTIGGGTFNTASGSDSTIGGGNNNIASGYNSTIPGGQNNRTQGNNSFAAGSNAKANADGCFVWGDDYWGEIVCNDNDRWLARATGGVYFYSDVALSTGVVLYPYAGAWSTTSDRNLKENFTPVDTHQLLENLAQVPITTWNYKGQDDIIRHIGPMAQDFYAAFDVGEDDAHISTIDPDGVALAAIQGLYAENQELKAQVEDLEARLSRLEDSSESANPINSSFSPLWLLGIGLVTFSSVWISRQKKGAWK